MSFQEITTTLTNKPDIYTKSQTDTLIQTAVNGIETFSGNYNDPYK